MASATVKVGGKKAKVAKVSKVKAGEKQEKKEKKPRAEFDLSKALDENGNAIKLYDGRLTALPANVPQGVKGLKRNAFTSKILYAQYQREQLVAQREKLVKRIEDKDFEIVDLKKGGDPRFKKVRRVKKLQAQIVALLESLKEDGIDPEDAGIKEIEE